MLSSKPFDCDPTISGYVVIATDTGHPVGTREYDNRAGAAGAAAHLNAEARKGPKFLARALGAVDREDFSMEFTR